MQEDNQDVTLSFHPFIAGIVIYVQRTLLNGEQEAYYANMSYLEFIELAKYLGFRISPMYHRTLESGIYQGGVV